MSESEQPKNWENQIYNPFQGDSSAKAGELASLLNRFVASLIDGLIVSAAASVLWMPIVMTGMVPWFLAPLMVSVIALGVFAVANYKLLDANGQTIGKKIMNVQIVMSDGSKVAAKEVLLKRYGVFFLVNSIPFVGGLIAIANVLLALRESRRAGHDEVADTKVVNC